MQPTGSGGGLSRGLARFRSAPATWLEALLESEEVEVEEEESILDLDPPPKPTTTPTQSFTPPPTAAANKTYVDPGLFSSPGSSAFLRQNSSPAEFLAQINSGSDGYFSNFGIPANYDYLPSSKRPREVDSADPSVKFSPQLVSTVYFSILCLYFTLNIINFFFRQVMNSLFGCFLICKYVKCKIVV